VLFTPERFAHLISLKKPGGGDVTEGQKEANKIRARQKTNADYGGFEQERAQTLTWIENIIAQPTIIQVRSLLPRTHPGTDLYYKEFDRVSYKHPCMVCRRVGPQLLVPVAYFPRDKIAPEHEIIYHSLPTARGHR
jgi:hypothetical protein